MFPKDNASRKGFKYHQERVEPRNKQEYLDINMKIVLINVIDK